MKLILSRFPNETLRIDDLISTSDTLFALNTLYKNSFNETVQQRAVFIEYPLNETSRSTIADLCEQHHLTDIVSFEESDLLFVSRLRTIFGLKGLNEATALNYRDKWAMRRQFSRAGLPAPECVLVESVADLQADNGPFPKVLKARTGMGAAGVTKCHSDDDLNTAFAASEELSMLLEEFVDWDVYHVDGFINEGALHVTGVGRYIGTLLGFKDGEVGGSVALKSKDFEYDILSTAAEDTYLNLGKYNSGTFHFEFFFRNGKWKLVEAAARSAGAIGKRLLNNSLGFDFERRNLELQLGVTSIERVLYPSGGEYVGAFLIPASRQSVLTDGTLDEFKIIEIFHKESNSKIIGSIGDYAAEVHLEAPSIENFVKAFG